MKKLIFVLLVAIVSVPAYSQLLKFGLKAGAQTTTVPTYDITDGTTNIEAVKDAAWGFHGGLFARINIAFLYIGPEVLFVSNSYEYNVTSGQLPELKKQTFNTLSVPVLLGAKIGPLRLNAGPAASVQIGSPKALIDDPNFGEIYKGALWGYQAGLGLDLFKKLAIDARIAGGLGDMLGDDVSIAGQTFNLDYSQTTFVVSLGIMF